MACTRSEPPTVVLVVLDNVRADHLKMCGYGRPTSPYLDSLCREGACSCDAEAPSTWTLPSHVTLLTGLSLPGHRVSDPSQRIDPLRRLLAQHLVDHGYRTAAFVSSPFLDRAYGFLTKLDQDTEPSEVDLGFTSEMEFRNLVIFKLDMVEQVEAAYQEAEDALMAVQQAITSQLVTQRREGG